MGHEQNLAKTFDSYLEPEALWIDKCEIISEALPTMNEASQHLF